MKTLAKATLGAVLLLAIASAQNGRATQAMMIFSIGYSYGMARTIYTDIPALLRENASNDQKQEKSERVGCHLLKDTDDDNKRHDEMIARGGMTEDPSLTSLVNELSEAHEKIQKMRQECIEKALY